MSLRTMLLAATVVAGSVGGVALAQTASTAPGAAPAAAAQPAATGATKTPAPPTFATFDPDQLPSIQGKVAQYSLTPRGDVDGLILADGTEVHTPPDLGTSLVYIAKPGDSVTVHGLKARAMPLVQAMSVTNDASGKTVVDQAMTGLGGPGPDRGRGGPGDWGPGHGRPGPAGWGPGHHRPAGQAMTIDGTIKQQLHGPRGDLNGVLMTDGTIVRLPPPEATRLASQLAPGATLDVRGDGITEAFGKVIDARAIGPNAGQMAEIARPMPHPPGPGFAPPPPPPPPPPGGPGAPPPTHP